MMRQGIKELFSRIALVVLLVLVLTVALASVLAATKAFGAESVAALAMFLGASDAEAKERAGTVRTAPPVVARIILPAVLLKDRAGEERFFGIATGMLQLFNPGCKGYYGTVRYTPKRTTAVVTFFCRARGVGLGGGAPA